MDFSKIKRGIENPLNQKRAHFEYEVVEQSETKEVVYEDIDRPYVQPECQVLLKSLGGADWSCDKFYCTITGDDALRLLRKGEVISADLSFCVTKCDDNSYIQRVNAKNIFTLNDYYQIREAEALYVGSIRGRAD